MRFLAHERQHYSKSSTLCMRLAKKYSPNQYQDIAFDADISVELQMQFIKERQNLF